MGYLGLGSTLTMLGQKYGGEGSLEFTEEVTKTLAIEGWKAGLDLSKEKGAAPIMQQEFTVTGEMLRKRPEMKKDGFKKSSLEKWPFLLGHVMQSPHQ